MLYVTFPFLFLQSAHAYVVVAGVTGNTLKDDVDRFIEAGADAVFSKPVPAEDIQRILSVSVKEPSPSAHS